MASMAMTFPVGSPVRSQTPLLPRPRDPGGSPPSVSLCFLLQWSPREEGGVSEKDKALERTEGVQGRDRDPGKPCLWRLPVSLRLLPSLPGLLPSCHIPALLASPPNSFPFKKKDAVCKSKH